MIPRAYITEWRAHAPWSDDAWVEQDLVISRALVAIFSVPALREQLAFRGGTALHKLHLAPASRYSEDIDLVQTVAGPIGDTLTGLRAVLDPWLGEPKRVLKEGRANLLYRFTSEGPSPRPMRLKVEINTREHDAALGHTDVDYGVANRWFSGTCAIRTFGIDELLGTKLRALYQRSKGRDLFDLSLAMERGLVSPNRLVQCFLQCMADGGHAATRAQVEANLHAKERDAAFRGDIAPLLRPGVTWDFDAGLERVREQLVSLLPGDPWRGDGRPS